jgi:hypothetical protein
MAVQYYDTETSGLDTAGIGKFWNRFKRVARRGLKVISPALSLVKGIAPMMPGIGTALAAGLSSAEALAKGKSLRDAALAGALGAVPGGAMAQRAAHMGAGAILRGKKRRHIHAYRKALNHDVRAAFDVGACEAADSLMRRGVLPSVVPVVHRANRDNLGSGQTAQAVRAIRKNPGMSVLQVAKAAGLPNGLVATAMAQSKPRRGRQRLLDSRTRAFIAKHAGHIFTAGTGGLDPSGKIWIVTSGDTGTKIAKAVVGDGNRWRELLGTNPEIARRAGSKKYGFAIYPGDQVQLPAGWTVQSQAQSVPAPVAALPTAGAILASLPSVLPMPTTWSDIPQPSAGPSAPSAAAPDPGVLQSRAELVAWTKTDGPDVAPFPDYGTDPAESGAQWSDRDQLTAQTFEILWDKTPGVNQTDGTGGYNEQLAIALDSWAQMKAQHPEVAVTGAPVTPGLLPGVLSQKVPTTQEAPPPAAPPPSPPPAPPSPPIKGTPVSLPPEPAQPPVVTGYYGPPPASAAGDNTALYVGAGLVAAAVLLLPSLK